jgi:protein TonB
MRPCSPKPFSASFVPPQALSIGVSLVVHACALASLAWHQGWGQHHPLPVEGGISSPTIVATLAAPTTVERPAPQLTIVRDEVRPDDADSRQPIAPGPTAVERASPSATVLRPETSTEPQLVPAPAMPGRATTWQSVEERNDAEFPILRAEVAVDVSDTGHDPLSAPPSTARRGAEGDHAATPVYNPAPVYPPAALAERKTGKVVLRIFLTANGRVSRAEVAVPSGDGRLDRAAVEAVQRWRFQAAPGADLREGDVVWHAVNFRIEP